jgi:chromosome segregation ATPase
MADTDPLAISQSETGTAEGAVSFEWSGPVPEASETNPVEAGGSPQAADERPQTDERQPYRLGDTRYDPGVTSVDPLSLFFSEAGNASHGHEANHGHEDPPVRSSAATEPSPRIPDTVRDHPQTPIHRLAPRRHLIGEMRIRANALDVRKPALDEGLLKANQTADFLAALESRLASLTEREQFLLGSERALESLEHRAADTTVAYERWIADLEARRQLMEETLAQVEQRAAGTTAGLERRLGEFDAQGRAIDQSVSNANQTINEGLSKANQTAELLTTLEARLASLTEREQRIRGSEQIVADLEHRAAETTVAFERWIGDLESQRQLMQEVVAQIEERVAGTRAELKRRLGEFDAHNQAIDEGLSKANQTTELLTTLVIRLASLTEREQLLQISEQSLAALEHRAAETTVAFERWIGDLEAQRQLMEETVAEVEQRAAGTTASLERHLGELGGQARAIDEGLSKANQAAASLTTLELRLASLEERDQLLRGSEQTLTALERRAADTTAAFERWIGDLEAQRQLMEETVAQIEQRATGTAAGLERRLGEFEVHRQAIDRTLLDAPGVINTLLELQARVAQLTGTGQELEKTARAVAEIERRTAEANGGLEQRFSNLEAKKQVIDRALIDTNRISEVLSGLDTRMTTLAERRKLIDRANDDVASLERRLDAMAARPELAARSGRVNFVLRRAALGASMPIQALGPGAQKLWRSLGWRGALVGCLGAAAVLFGVAYRSGQSQQTLLSSESLRLPPLAPVPLPQSVARDRSPVKTVTATQPPTVVAGDTILRDSARNAGGAQQFVGDLTIESQPAGATVLLNQRPVGKTPILLTSVRAGSYVLWIEHEGYNRWTGAVLVSAVNQTRINAKLEPADRR